MRAFATALVAACLLPMLACEDPLIGCGGATCPFGAEGYARITGTVLRKDGTPLVRASRDAVFVLCPTAGVGGYGASSDASGTYVFQLESYSPTERTSWCLLRVGMPALPVDALDSVRVTFSPDRASQTTYMVNLRER